MISINKNDIKQEIPTSPNSNTPLEYRYIIEPDKKKRLKFDSTEYNEYLRKYNKAKANKLFSSNTLQYKYIKNAKLTLYDMGILCSTIDGYIICSEYFKESDPIKWKGKVSGLKSEIRVREVIDSCPFIHIISSESQTSE